MLREVEVPVARIADAAARVGAGERRDRFPSAVCDLVHPGYWQLMAGGSDFVTTGLVPPVQYQA